MVSGAFAAIFGADCGKRRPTQVDWVVPPPACIPQSASVDDKNEKKSTAKLQHRQYTSLNMSNIGFGALAAVFGEYCGKNAPDTGVLR